MEALVPVQAAALVRVGEQAPVRVGEQAPVRVGEQVVGWGVVPVAVSGTNACWIISELSSLRSFRASRSIQHINQTDT